MLVTVPVLDFHITHNCNLTCDGCSDFTNSGHSKMVSLEEAEEWISYWNKRLKPKQFILLGGEPTLHKNLIDFLYLSRRLWGDEIHIKLTTNGFFIHNHPNLGIALKENNITMSLSIHSKSDEYMNRIKSNLQTCLMWKKNLGVRISINTTHEYWTEIYKGYGPDILPFEDNNPEESWNNCFMDGTCFQLHEGKIWKCPPLAYLPMQAQKYNLSDKWNPYLKYIPLDYNCTDKEIEEFFNRKAEPVCAMCPAYKNYKTSEKSPLLSVSDTIDYFRTLQ